jgi:hypothetical protein
MKNDKYRQGHIDGFEAGCEWIEKRIGDALGTAERGEALIEIARNARTTKLVLRKWISQIVDAAYREVEQEQSRK